MASRQEEKQRRREERLARERAEAAAAARRKRIQLALGAVLGLAVVVGVVVLALGVFSKDSSGAAEGDPTAPVASVKLPEQQTSNVDDAAKAAGCTLQHPPIEGRGHEAKDFKPSDYKTNPPTSGAHNPTPAADGLYVAGNEPAIENWVHTLEHGRVLLQYRPGTGAPVVGQLQNLFNEDVKGSGNGYHSVLMQNNSNMPFQVAAVAWRHYMGCRAFSPKSIEALRTFREALIDKAPEKIP